jgi:DNA-binding MarR family transcriptional regulator
MQINSLPRVPTAFKLVNMADINTATAQTKRPDQRTFAIDAPALADLTSVVELIFFAYRDFTGESDAALKELEFGRAHHRVLHFVTWRPGLRVADLLEILKITKQSLARVLKQLVDRKFISQEAGEDDRRVRRLYATPQGRRLAEQLRSMQTQRIGEALAGIDPTNQAAALRFLLALTAPADRINIARSLATFGVNEAAAGNVEHDRQNKRLKD